jgi:hypothetical protein
VCFNGDSVILELESPLFGWLELGMRFSRLDKLIKRRIVISFSGTTVLPVAQ